MRTKRTGHSPLNRVMPIALLPGNVLTERIRFINQTAKANRISRSKDLR